jgi:hypothetical protein
LRNNDWTKILGWPGYRVYRSEIDEDAKTLKLWVRRKPGKLVCPGMLSHRHNPPFRITVAKPFPRPNTCTIPVQRSLGNVQKVLPLVQKLVKPTIQANASERRAKFVRG